MNGTPPACYGVYRRAVSSSSAAGQSPDRPKVFHYVQQSALGMASPDDTIVHSLWTIMQPLREGVYHLYVRGAASVCIYCVNCTKFGQLILKINTKIDATRCQIFRLKCTKFVFGWGSSRRSPRPHTLAGLKGAYF